MRRPVLYRVLIIALVLGAFLPAAAGIATARAASVHQGGPPSGIDASRPTVSGFLVAKPITGEGPTGPVICRDRDRSAETQALMANRGLVICTDEGKLVLLQLSAKTGLYNRNWRALSIAGMSLRDHINAWGVLGSNGLVLNPTFAVQDTSKPHPTLNLVSGRLVAKPISGELPAAPVVCGDRDQTPAARALMANRGLVLCTEEGKLVLLVVSARTRIYTHDRAAITVPDLTLGDHINAWGILGNNGFVLNPTVTAVDTDLQVKATNSQDFIANGGQVLTLYVLKSDSGGPVEGMIHAEQRGTARVVLCSGRLGAWRDLLAGQTINITASIFNRRIMTYVDTDYVKVVSC